MLSLVGLLLHFLRSFLRSRAELEAEIALLRQQLFVAKRRAPRRPIITDMDRLLLAWLCRLWPRLLSSMVVVQPETVLRWHRAGFRAFWRWKSRSRGGRPRIDPDLRALIRHMRRENALWGAPRIHGELLKLGFQVSQSSVAKYMIRRRGPPSQGWRTFLRNHAPEIAAIDLFVVPTPRSKRRPKGIAARWRCCAATSFPRIGRSRSYISAAYCDGSANVVIGTR